MTIEKETVGERIKQLRKKNGMTQSELGKVLNITHPQVSNIEKGKNSPTNDSLQLLSSTFNVSLDWLLTGSESTAYKSNANIINQPAPGYNLFADLPFIPVKARASFVESFQTQSSYSAMDTYRVYNIDEELLKKEPIIIEIDGDSMEPQLRSGMKVIAVPVDKGEWPYKSGRVCAVSFRDFFVVKRIMENRLATEGTLMLASDNPTGGTMVVKHEEIYGIWETVETLPAKIV